MAISRQQPAEAQLVEAVNPATGEVVGRYPRHTPDDVEEALNRARDAYLQWRETRFAERADLLRRAADYLREQKPRFATLISTEMGKPVSESEAEIDKCAWNCDFYAQHAQSMLADEPRESSASESYVVYDPLGVVLAVMPWNFPFWQAIRFAAPALMAGNTAILKHSSNVPGCALAIEEVFRASGMPPGAFQSLVISGRQAEELVADPRIAAVTLTGSDDAGSHVASAAGRALKPSVLELGGSDPFVVLADANLEEATKAAIRARFQNTGQSCIAAKRFVVVDAVHDEFVRRLADGIRELKIGDPLDPTTQIGPLARPDLRDDLDRQVRESVDRGAKLVLGGKPLPGPGSYYAPTLLTGVTWDVPAYREETFGPVAAVVRVQDEEQAIHVANHTVYGLGASIWTRDIERAKRLARRIQAGNVFVNGVVASDPRLPFGGVKRSGYGRELSELGIREFVNVKTLWVGPATAKQAPSPNKGTE